MARTTRRATSAKRESENNVNNRNTAIEKTAEAVEILTAEETRNESVAVMPAVVETATRVEAEAALHSANVLKANVKEERRGANVTIRLIATRAASGDENAINVLCALCNMPKEFLFAITLNDIREAVKNYYPYYIEDENRNINVKASGFWYTTACQGEPMEDAAKRVTRGFRAVPVEDYLEQLIMAAKCRAKGVKPRRVNADAVYTDGKMSVEVEGITTSDINEAKARKAYAAGKTNVWRKFMDAFWI